MKGTINLSDIENHIAPGLQREVINAIGQDGLLGNEVIADMVRGIHNVLADNGLELKDIVIDLELGDAKGKTLEQVFKTLGNNTEVKGE